jgi:RNA polymerase sigma factor (sigma-70 family)
MAGLGSLLRRIGRDDPLTACSDAELLASFLREQSASAFEMIVRRHGGLVMRICQRELYQQSDAEDVFQATFLTLVRAARSIRQENHMASWLAGVARRIARRLAQQLRQRRARLLQHAERQQSVSDRTSDAPSWWEEEQRHLPEEYRTVIDLCLIQGLTREEAATQLGQTPSAIHGLLYRARLKLKKQLLQRGTVAGAALIATQASSAIDKLAFPIATAAVELLRTGHIAKSLVSPTVAQLVSQTAGSWQVPVLIAGCLLTAGVGWWGMQLLDNAGTSHSSPVSMVTIQPTLPEATRTIPEPLSQAPPIPNQSVQQQSGQGFQTESTPQQAVQPPSQPQVMNALPQQQRGGQAGGFEPERIPSPGSEEVQLRAMATPTATGVMRMSRISELPHLSTPTRGMGYAYISLITTPQELQTIRSPKVNLNWDERQHPIDWSKQLLILVVLSGDTDPPRLFPMAKPWLPPNAEGVGYVLLHHSDKPLTRLSATQHPSPYVLLLAPREKLNQVAVSIWRPGTLADGVATVP